jgi:hypothetical protein
MARTFGMIWSSMWNGEDFRSLSRDAQCTYVLIRTQESVSAAGVTPVQLRWWSQSQADLTPEMLMRDIDELAAAGFVTVDYDTEELQLRYFIVTDQVYRKPNAFTAAARAITKIKSDRIKAALCAELRDMADGLVQPVATPEVIELTNGLIRQLDRYAIPSRSDPDPIANGSRSHADPIAMASREVPVTPGIRSVVQAGTEGPDLRQKTENAKPPATGVAGEASLAGADIENLCQHLRDRIIANGCRPPNITAGWRDAARLLIDRDHCDPRQAHALINWCTNDEFWKRNIMSMQTFRKQYDRIRLAAEAERDRQGAGRNGAARLSVGDSRRVAAEEIKARLRQARHADLLDTEGAS